MSKKKLIPVKIPRKKWLRGNGGLSQMSCPSGSKCCLGHVATACGIPKRYLVNQMEPGDVHENLSRLGIPVPEAFKALTTSGWSNTEVATKAMAVNDRELSSKFTAEDREKEIKKLLKKARFDVEFV